MQERLAQPIDIIGAAICRVNMAAMQRLILQRLDITDRSQFRFCSRPIDPASCPMLRAHARLPLSGEVFRFDSRGRNSVAPNGNRSGNRSGNRCGNRNGKKQAWRNIHRAMAGLYLCCFHRQISWIARKGAWVVIPDCVQDGYFGRA